MKELERLLKALAYKTRPMTENSRMILTFVTVKFIVKL